AAILIDEERVPGLRVADRIAIEVEAIAAEQAGLQPALKLRNHVAVYVRLVLADGAEIRVGNHIEDVPARGARIRRVSLPDEIRRVFRHRAGELQAAGIEP